MKTEVIVEWLLEVLDGPDDGSDPDILDVRHAATFEAVRKYVRHEVENGWNPDHMRIGLVRDRGNEDEGIICRSWAYISSGKLPSYFNDTDQDVAKVPAKYQNEIDAYMKKNPPE